MSKSVSVSKRLLAQGVSPDVRGVKQTTPLMRTVLPSVAALLVSSGADVNATDENGWSALHHAIYSHASGVLRCLLKSGADPNRCNRYDDTPLHFAADEHSVKDVSELINHETILDLGDNFGFTPLKTALVARRFSITRRLLSHGACVLHKGSHNVGVIEWVEYSDNKDVLSAFGDVTGLRTAVEIRRWVSRHLAIG
jgi:uncharacterized protein